MNELRSLVVASIRFRYVVVFLALMTLILGAIQVGRMPVDVFPEFAPPQVEVQTPALGLSAEEVESSDHRSDGRVVRGPSGTGHDAIEVGGAAVVDQADLRP